MRVQKCQCREHQGNKQFNVNVYENKSEWAIFRGDCSDEGDKAQSLMIQKDRDFEKGILKSE